MCTSCHNANDDCLPLLLSKQHCSKRSSLYLLFLQNLLEVSDLLFFVCFPIPVCVLFPKGDLTLSAAQHAGVKMHTSYLTVQTAYFLLKRLHSFALLPVFFITAAGIPSWLTFISSLTQCLRCICCVFCPVRRLGGRHNALFLLLVRPEIAAELSPGESGTLSPFSEWKTHGDAS